MGPGCVLLGGYSSLWMCRLPLRCFHDCDFCGWVRVHGFGTTSEQFLDVVGMDKRYRRLGYLV